MASKYMTRPGKCASNQQTKKRPNHSASPGMPSTGRHNVGSSREAHFGGHFGGQQSIVHPKGRLSMKVQRDANASHTQPPHLGKHYDRDTCSESYSRPSAKRHHFLTESHATSSSSSVPPPPPLHSNTSNHSMNQGPKLRLGKRRCSDLPSPQHSGKKQKPSNDPRDFKGKPSRKHVRKGRQTCGNEEHYTKDMSWRSSVECLSENELILLSMRSSDTIVNELHRKIKGLQVTLSLDGESMKNPVLEKPGVMDVIVLILSKVASVLSCNSEANSKAVQILGEVLSDRCAVFQLKLREYVNDLCLNQKYQSVNKLQLTVEKKIENISVLFHKTLQSLPSSSWSCLPVDEFKKTVDELTSNGTLEEGKKSIDKILEDLMMLRDNARTQDMQRKQRQVSRKGIDYWAFVDYQSIPILPEWNEVCCAQYKPHLQANKINGGYLDWSEYFSIQFHLLREDFVGPLRKGICGYLGGKRGRELSNIRVYKNARVKEPIFLPDGLCYNLKLSFSLKKNSKRLLPGSLIFLSPENDNFTDEVHLAIVRKRDEIDNRILSVQFQGQEGTLSLSEKETTFIIIEPSAYLEASYHVIHNLQNCGTLTMPFATYLVTGDCAKVDQPDYLQECVDEPYNLSFILTEKGKDCYVKKLEDNRDSSLDHSSHNPYSIRSKCLLIQEPTNSKLWPPNDQTEFDNSQLRALRMALTQEIAVIQGPPGTGKTYIGLKIVEALLLNKRIWKTSRGRSPILIMCYTNHALDQFLEGILDSPIKSTNLIRVGGRSKSKRLQSLNLVERRRVVKLPASTQNKKRLAEKRVREFDQSKVLKYYKMKAKCQHLPLKYLNDIIDPHHYHQLFNRAQSEQQHFLALEDWLGFCRVNRPDVIAAYSRLVQKRSAISITKPEEPQQSHESSESEAECEADINNDATFLHSDLLEEAGLILDESWSELKFSDHKMLYLSSLNRQCRRKFRELDESEIPQFDANWVRKVLEAGFSVSAMSKEEESRVIDIHTLSFEDRWRLYQLWRSQYLRDFCKSCEEELWAYNDFCRKQKNVRRKADRFVLETADIIGMTTTGAARIKDILEEVKPRIVIVEEAAEVLESHIVSALNAGTQHLILIGDHKQLRPKPNEYELELNYNLSVSLFERLVRSDFPHTTLEYQHRMRPEIAELVSPHIYETLSNHESVEKYPAVEGVSSNLFFINHNHKEEEDDSKSHSNAHEATFLISLCTYLLKQRYTPKQISILVTYSGQLHLMRELISKHEDESIKQVRVDTVDNYQGEENDIILLSLVRSNDKGIIGFLKEENRVCVALSRAREGFYCIGNFSMLRKKAPIWDAILSDMEEKKRLGDGLVLSCKNHKTPFTAKTSEDFAKHSPKGGCNMICKSRLPCGHMCRQKCHSTDPEHEEYKCEANCMEKCLEGHPCTKKCWETCQCMVEVTRPIPGCNHEQKMCCYQDPSEVTCTSRCGSKCPKGHPCPRKCHHGESCKPCKVPVLVTMPICDHEQLIECSQDPESVPCKEKCTQKCKNGHPCPKLCHEDCGKCVVSVTKTIPECNHEISLPCHAKPQRKRCSQKVVVELPDCGHEIQVTCAQAQDKTNIVCPEKCQRNLPSCDHPCSQKCGEPCTTLCTEEVEKEWPCGHTLKRPCYQILDPDNYPCKEKCSRKLECGHLCSKLCSEPCDETCTYLCSHILACGHKCDGKCSECTATHMHKPCNFQMKIKRYCGHVIQVSCRGLADSHSKTAKSVNLLCSHGRKPISSCSDLRYTCDKRCEWNCAHHKCSKHCCERCSRPRCNKRCQQRLACGHQCYGLCGERCLSICPKCDQQRFASRLKSPEPFTESDTYFQLVCRDIFTVKYLDRYVHQACNPKQGSDLLVSPLQCPHCSHPFRGSYRYGNQAKELLSHVQSVQLEMNSIPFSAYKFRIRDESSIKLRQQVKKFTESPNYHSVKQPNCKYPWYKPFLFQDEGLIDKDQVPVCYKPMPEISATLYKLESFSPVQKEEKYLVYVFIAALSMLERLQRLNVTECKLVLSTLGDVKHFLRFVSSLIKDSDFQLSYQTVTDLKHAFFRLHLCMHMIAVKPNAGQRARKRVAEVESFLKVLESSHSHITKSDFQRHMDALGKHITREEDHNVDVSKMLTEMDAFCPDVYKGQWRRCGKEGHYYCSPPSLLEDIEVQCPKCKGYENYVKLPDQKILRQKFQAGNLTTMRLPVEGPLEKSGPVQADKGFVKQCGGNVVASHPRSLNVVRRHPHLSSHRPHPYQPHGRGRISGERPHQGRRINF